MRGLRRHVALDDQDFGIGIYNKGDLFIMENKMTTYKTTYGYREIEYKMTPEMAKEILKTRKGVEQNMHPQAFLCKYVNEELGVRGNCVKVLTTL